LRDQKFWAIRATGSPFLLSGLASPMASACGYRLVKHVAGKIGAFVRRDLAGAVCLAKSCQCHANERVLS